MKKKKEYNVFNKIRAALRQIYRFSPMRREILKAALYVDPRTKNKFFLCPLCETHWHEAMAEVDHEPPLGPLNKFFADNENGLSEWAYNLFNGDTRVICKICHKKKTKEQRKKK